MLFFRTSNIPNWLGTDRNDFFFSHSQPVLSCFGLKRSHNDVFKFFEFFCYFSGIPYSVSGWNVSEREFFFSHILSLSRHVLAWKEAILMFFNFLNFFSIFLEFPIPGRVGMDQNENFFSLTFASSPVSFWL